MVNSRWICLIRKEPSHLQQPFQERSMLRGRAAIIGDDALCVLVACRVKGFLSFFGSPFGLSLFGIEHRGFWHSKLHALYIIIYIPILLFFSPISMQHIWHWLTPAGKIWNFVCFFLKLVAEMTQVSFESTDKMKLQVLKGKKLFEGREQQCCYYVLLGLYGKFVDFWN